MSDDDPLSEAQFKTLKYHVRQFPGRVQALRAKPGRSGPSFFRARCNAEHRFFDGISHACTPEQVHFGNRRSGHCRQEIYVPPGPHGPLMPNASSEVCRSPNGSRRHVLHSILPFSLAVTTHVRCSLPNRPRVSNCR